MLLQQSYGGQSRPQQHFGAARRHIASIPARMVIPPALSALPSDKMSSSDKIFKRTCELTYLGNKVDQEPGVMTVVLGPSDCGKTTLLNAFLDKIKQERRIFRLDLRTFDSTCSELFTSMLWKSFSTVPDVSRRLCDSSEWTIVKDSPSFHLGILQREILSWLKSSKGVEPAPILFIDFAERMMSWRNHGYLQGFLDFLVVISKQENLVHVILASSEEPFIDFLQAHRVGDGRFQLLTVGNLAEEDAKAYLLGGGEGGWPGCLKTECSRAVSLGFDCPQQIWETVYRLSGGNTGAMKRLAKTAALEFLSQRDSDLDTKNTASWEIAFEDERYPAQKKIAQGFEPDTLPARGRDSPAWSSEQWQTVLDALAEAGPHYVVKVSEMKRKLSNGDSEAGSVALASLLKFHMVDCRQPSSLAEDIPYHAYGGEPVITAPSAAVLDLILSRRQQAADT